MISFVEAAIRVGVEGKGVCEGPVSMEQLAEDKTKLAHTAIRMTKCMGRFFEPLTLPVNNEIGIFILLLLIDDIEVRELGT